MSPKLKEEPEVVSAPELVPMPELALAASVPTLQDKIRSVGVAREVDAGVIEVLLAIAAEVEQLRLRK